VSGCAQEMQFFIALASDDIVVIERELECKKIKEGTKCMNGPGARGGTSCCHRMSIGYHAKSTQGQKLLTARQTTTPCVSQQPKFRVVKERKEGGEGERDRQQQKQNSKKMVNPIKVCREEGREPMPPPLLHCFKSSPKIMERD
jgi:hypothetical protein